MANSRTLFLYFRLFKTVDSICRWLDSNREPLDWKRPLYQQSYHHCPLILTPYLSPLFWPPPCRHIKRPSDFYASLTSPYTPHLYLLGGIPLWLTHFLRTNWTRDFFFFVSTFAWKRAHVHFVHEVTQPISYKMGHPRPLFHLFWSFQTNNTILTIN